MEQLNRVELCGHVGTARVSNFGNGTSCLRFCVATNYAYKSSDGETVIETTWHNIIKWGKPEEFQGISKGTSVHVTGRIHNQRYMGQDGEERICTEIVATELSIVDTPVTVEM